MEEKSYFEQLDDIRLAFDYGQQYEMLVLNSSMHPLLKAYETRIKLVSVNEHNKLLYGTIVLYSRMSQSISIRWIKGFRVHSVDLRGVLQSHSENKIPFSSIIGIVSEFTYHGQWVKSNSIKGFLIKCWYTIISFGYRITRPIRNIRKML